MSRTRVEQPITTRNARRRLKPQQKPYFRGLGPLAAIGYRKHKRGGFWVARMYLGKTRYHDEQFAVADDVLPADGVNVLDFEQAKAAATARIATWRATSLGPQLTVLAGLLAYIAARDAAAPGGKCGAASRLRLHVLSDPLAALALADVDEQALVDWRERRPCALAPATVARIASDLRAAMNMAAKMHRAKLPADFSAKVRAGLSIPAHSMPVARDGAALSDADVRRIVEAAQRVDEGDGWEGDLVRLIVALAATGARFSQVMRMQVADVQGGRLMLPTSRKGRSAAGKAARIAVPVGEDVLALIRPAVAGRPVGAPLFERWWHEMRNGVRHRARRGPWTLAAELQRPWAKILTEAGLPKSVVPYALRHSSICRMLRQGLPVRLVAAVHDTSSEMLEKHYSGAITSLLDDLLAGAVVPLLPGKEQVVPLRARRRD